MAFLEQPFHFGTSGKFYENASDPGSMLFGGAGQSNSLGQKRDGTKGGLFGDKAQGIDWLGSPVTAGTDSQGTARLAAILYGLWAVGGAMGSGEGAGEAGGSTGMGDYLKWGSRGYNAYNALKGMNGSGGVGGDSGGGVYRQRSPSSTANTNPLTGLTEDDMRRIIAGRNDGSWLYEGILRAALQDSLGQG